MKKGTALLAIRQLLGHLGHCVRHEQVCSVGAFSSLNHSYQEYGVGTSWEEALKDAAHVKEAML